MSADTMLQRLAAIENDALGPEYFTAQRIAADAQQLAAEMKPAAPPTAAYPLDSGEITEAWIDQTIDLDATQQRLDKRRGVLLELANTARGHTRTLHQAAHSRILTAYGHELQTLLTEVRQISDELGDVDTAAKAIANDAAPQWKRLTELRDDYTALRAAQHAKTDAEVLFATSPDYPGEDHASDLYLRNLDKIWPQWRKGGRDDRALNLNPDPREQRREPWPADRTEILLWLVRSTAQPWIPNDDELEELRQDRIAFANPMPKVIPGPPDLSNKSPRQSAMVK